LKTFPDAMIIILPPKTIKIESCKMVYKVMDNKKVARNGKGRAGGNFDKNDMFLAFLESDLDMELKNFLNNDNIKKMKNIPKPFDDIIDSIFITEIIKKKINI
jgi:hypothetical protein